MAYSFSKSKIPKSLSFPIKRSAFDILLGDSNIKSLSIVYFSVPRLSVVVEGRFLSADKKIFVMMLIACMFVIIRHYENIIRLVNKKISL